ncbi:hypothetical protein CRG98_006774 [Punica granatum]|uniref:Uncharacterized protein n=1 Tax=Punica granatum TaxID=22663 RepID=A0A2I0KWM2_PUNGR|nr:hypothetical protein CRG98_006774 [Punica granatum]
MVQRDLTMVAQTCGIGGVDSKLRQRPSPMVAASSSLSKVALPLSDGPTDSDGGTELLCRVGSGRVGSTHHRHTMRSSSQIWGYLHLPAHFLVHFSPIPWKVGDRDF